MAMLLMDLHHHLEEVGSYGQTSGIGNYGGVRQVQLRDLVTGYNLCRTRRLREFFPMSKNKTKPAQIRRMDAT